METLTKHFRELTRAAFARYGFAYAEVIARWPEVVGEDLARVSRPDRIRWPKGAGAEAAGFVVCGADSLGKAPESRATVTAGLNSAQSLCSSLCATRTAIGFTH